MIDIKQIRENPQRFAVASKAKKFDVDIDRLLELDARIQENKKNIFLYQVKGVKIQFNNIHDPGDYNIAIAEEQDTDIDAGNNWWGTINKEKIEETVYDKMDDEEVGRIIYEPVLRTRVKGAGI